MDAVNKRPNLTIAFVECVECCFLTIMRLRMGIFPYETRVDIIEKKGNSHWLIRIFFYLNGQDYCYTFRRKSTWHLIDPTYMTKIVEKLMKKFQIRKNKERANFMLKRAKQGFIV